MIRVHERKGKIPVGTAYCLATQYQIKGGFVPQMIWVFETDDVDLDALKNFVDDYFTTVLQSDLYVKEVPQDSALFPQEALRLYGTVDVICAFGPE
jgi:hypothetical protein